ncbi:MAG: hypothetical protein JKY99_06440, partial [Rhizobiales bacterium]|nr:hypothetical protein [Hyphomicrobiales bacterium]
AIDRAGLGEDGAAIADLPLSTELIAGIFESDVGLENPTIEGIDQIVWYEVTGVTADRDRTLDEVTSRVTDDWRKVEVAKQLDTLVESLVEELSDSASFEAMADARGAGIQIISAVTRTARREGLNASNITAIFELADNGFGYLAPDNVTQRFVVELFSKSTPDYSAEDSTVQQIATAVGAAYENELLNQYVAELQSNLNVTLNQPLLTQMLAGSQDQ